MSKVSIYRTAWCPYCQRAEALLSQKQAQFSAKHSSQPKDAPHDLFTAFDIDIIDIEQQPGKRAEMQARSGRTSVPQIFINQLAIGGYDDLAELERKDQLDALLR